MATKLAFGLNAAVPDDTTGAWGGRFIVTQDGHVDLPWDRTDGIGDDREWLYKLLEQRYPQSRLRKDLAEALRERRIDTRVARLVTLYEDEDLAVKANSNASAGYVYVAAWLKGV